MNTKRYRHTHHDIGFRLSAGLEHLSLTLTRLCLIVLCCVLEASALQNWNVKTNAAQNDISDLANWTSTTDKDVQFNSPLNPAAPELWMSQDVTFGRIVLGTTNLIFNLGQGRTLSTGAAGETKLNIANTFVRLTSGTVLQSANYLNIGQQAGASNCVLIVEGPYTRYLASNLSVLIGNGSNAVSCGLGVYNGAVMDGKFYIGNNSFSSQNWLEASGQGTTLWSTNGAHFYVGNSAASCWNRFLLADSAAVKMKGGTFFVGANKDANFNTATLLSGASVTGQTETVVGNSGSWNTLTGSDAELRMSGYLTVGWYGGGNTLRLTNSLIQATGLYVGRDVTSWGSNTLEFAGCTLTNTAFSFQFGMNSGGNAVTFRDGTSLAVSTASIGGSTNAPSNSVILADRSTLLVAGQPFNLGNVSSHNTMIVDNSSFMVSNATFCIGYAKDMANSNTFAVINGGYCYALRLRVGDQGSYTQLIISNGTVHAGTDNCTIPFNTSGSSTNNRIVFAGSHCLLKSETDIYVRCGTTLEFRIPRGGYQEPPMQTIVTTGKNIALDPTTRIALDISEFAKGGGGKQILARTIGGFAISQTTLNSLNVQLAPQHCSVAIVDNELILSTPYTGGTVLRIN